MSRLTRIQAKAERYLRRHAFGADTVKLRAYAIAGADDATRQGGTATPTDTLADPRPRVTGLDPRKTSHAQLLARGGGRVRESDLVLTGLGLTQFSHATMKAAAEAAASDAVSIVWAIDLGDGEAEYVTTGYLERPSGWIVAVARSTESF